MIRVKLFAVALVLCLTGVVYAAGDNASRGARHTKKAVASCCAGHKAKRTGAQAQASKADSKDSCCQSGASCCASGAACCAKHQHAAGKDAKDAAASCPMDGSAKDCGGGGGACCDGGSCCAKHGA